VRVCPEPELVKALDAASEKLSQAGDRWVARGEVAAG
jgi:hypothetical protein